MMKKYALRKKRIVEKGRNVIGKDGKKKSVPPKYEYSYVTESGRKITDKAVLKHIHTIRVPPAYDDVKINLVKGEKLFAYGIDVAGRPQYIYNQRFVDKQTAKKYCKLIKFERKLPMINERIDRLVAQKKWTMDKVIAIILRIILHCNFRIGNDIYRRKYNSFGVTTVTRDHMTFSGDGRSVRIKFIGKKGVENDCTIRDKTLISAMKRIDKINRANGEGNGVGNGVGGKGDPYFTYTDDKSGVLKVVRALDVNNFLGKFGQFTSKDYRTWSANIALLGELCREKVGDTKTARKKELGEVIDKVAVRLHHTPAICKKSYIDNDILDMYMEKPEEFKALVKGCDGRGECVNKVFVDFLRKKC